MCSALLSRGWSTPVFCAPPRAPCSKPSTTCLSTPSRDHVLEDLDMLAPGFGAPSISVGLEGRIEGSPKVPRERKQLCSVCTHACLSMHVPGDTCGPGSGRWWRRWWRRWRQCGSGGGGGGCGGGCAKASSSSSSYGGGAGGGAGGGTSHPGGSHRGAHDGGSRAKASSPPLRSSSYTLVCSCRKSPLQSGRRYHRHQPTRRLCGGDSPSRQGALKVVPP